MKLFTLRSEKLGKSERHATVEELKEIGELIGKMKKTAFGGHEVIMGRDE